MKAQAYTCLNCGRQARTQARPVQCRGCGESDYIYRSSAVAVMRQRRRWPLQPLVEELGLSPIYWAIHYGVSGTTLRLIRDFGFTDSQADRFAIAAGFHPAEIWGAAWAASAQRDQVALLMIERAS